MPNDNFDIQKDLTVDDQHRLQNAKTIAVDTELTGLNPYRDALCLIQICDEDGNVTMIRADNWPSAERLKSVLTNQKISKVFHYALVDCAFILINLGVEVSNPYCTKIASKIIRTYSSDHTLRGLVKEICNIDLDKRYQNTDWFNTNLSPDQLEYAANDVIWLLKIKEELDRKILSRGKLPTGIDYAQLNASCQSFIPSLVHLWINGWSFGQDNTESIFAY